MRKLLCKWFGHMRTSGWWGDGLYGKVRNNGRGHYAIVLRCDRCDEKYVAARFHRADVVDD